MNDIALTRNAADPAPSDSAAPMTPHAAADRAWRRLMRAIDDGDSRRAVQWCRVWQYFTALAAAEPPADPPSPCVPSAPRPTRAPAPARPTWEKEECFFPDSHSPAPTQPFERRPSGPEP